MNFFNIIFFSILVFFFNSAFAIKKMNPDISVNVLLLGKKTSSKEGHKETARKGKGEADKTKGQRAFTHHAGHDHGEEDHHSNEGFSVQEVEFYFKSNIDPYWTGNVSLGIAQHGRDFELDLEEAYVESLFMPSLTLKAGKFYAFIGRHNILHTHYYPFIDPPLVNQNLFGFHGWSNSGISLAYLTPLPWYSEVIVQAFYKYEKEEDKPSLFQHISLLRRTSEASERKPFAGIAGIAGIVFFKNFWDLNDTSTLELDLTYGAGVKTFKHLYNAALVWKWKTLESAKQQSLSWTTEWMQVLGDASSENKTGGVGSYIQWQFLKNWWLEGRAEYLSLNEWKDIETQKYSVLISFAATEYSAVRLQYDTKKSHQGEWEHSVAIQSNMSLGAHPAHLY